MEIESKEVERIYRYNCLSKTLTIVSMWISCSLAAVFVGNTGVFVFSLLGTFVVLFFWEEKQDLKKVEKKKS